MSEPIRATFSTNTGIQVRTLALGRPVSLSQLSDVNLSTLADGSMLIYDGATNKFISNTEIKNHNTQINGGNY